MDIPAQEEDPVFPKDPYAILPLRNNYLRRTNSFDASDIYNESGTGIDVVPRQCQSEPDLSKYGLFVEPEVIVECGPYEPAPLTINKLNYDASCPPNSKKIFSRKRKLETESELTISETFRSLSTPNIKLVLLKKRLLKIQLQEEIDKITDNRLLRDMEMEVKKRKYELNERTRKLELESFN